MSGMDEAFFDRLETGVALAFESEGEAWVDTHSGDRLARVAVNAVSEVLEGWLEKHDKEVRAEAWDEGNAEPRSGLPRCPVCDDRTVSLHNRGDHSEWKHDDDGTLICGGSLTKAVWKDHNPYRAISEIVEGNK